MEANAKHLGGMKFEVTARDHVVVCDQPATNGGTDAGMTPPEFLLVSLATCAGYYAAEYMKTRGLITDLNVHVSAEKAAQPARLAKFYVAISAPGLDERHRTGILRAAKSCLIHNTLLGSPEIEIVVETTATVDGPLNIAA
jgi:putative redox protein